MSDCISSSWSAHAHQNQTSAPRRPHYGSFYLALAVPAGLIVWFLRRLPLPAAASLFGDPRPLHAGARRVREVTPRRLDPAKVAAAADAYGGAIARGARTIQSLRPRLPDSFHSGWTGRPAVDQHLGYPLIESLEAAGYGCGRLLVPAPALRRRDAPRSDGLCRLCDEHASPWILKAAGGETFVDPSGLTDESTRILVSRLKITTKFVVLVMRELHEQNWGLSQESKEERFAEVAGQSLERLIELACSISDARWSDRHISQQLTVFDALADVLFNTWDLCSNRSAEVAGIIDKMVDAFKGVIQRTSDDTHGSKENTIHPATVVFTRVLEFFHRNRDLVQPILNSGYDNTDPCSDMFNCWISKLKEGAEIIFQDKGQRYIFILNNTKYVLEMKCHPGLLRPNVVSNLDSLIEQYILRYIDEHWFPPMRSYLDGDSLKKPRRSSMKKFTEEFFSICDRQKAWKVQTELKKILREKIANVIVSKYVTFSEALHANPIPRWRPSRLKGMWRTRSEKPEIYWCAIGRGDRKIVRGITAS